MLLCLALAAQAFMVAPQHKLQQALLSQGQQQSAGSRAGVRTLVARAPEFGRKQVRGEKGIVICAGVLGGLGRPTWECGDGTRSPILRYVCVCVCVY